MKNLIKLCIAAVAAFAVIATGTTVASAATDVTLSSLSVSSGPITPDFASNTTTYSSAAALDVASITVNASATLSNATVQFRISGGAYTQPTTGAGSATFNIVDGANTVDVLVISQDGVLSTTYSLVVDRGGLLGAAAVNPADATLSSLTGSSLALLNPVFASATLNYTSVVDNATSTTTISAVTTQIDANMSVSVDGGAPTALTSTNPSGTINLKIGSTSVVITVVAPDTTTTQSYTLIIYRAPLFPNIPLTCPTLDCTINLHADNGVVNIKDVTAPNGSVDVPFYGFGVNGAPVGLAGSPNSTIKVKLGTVLHINFSEALPTSVSLAFPSLAVSSVVGSGTTYTVTADKLGTMVYEPGSNSSAPRQIAMGLVGVMIVVPADCATAMCAYDSAVSYSDEAVVATTDIDVEFANSPTTFNMGYFGQSRTPDGSPRQVYHLINGKSYPDTDPINVRPTDSVLIRSVNAGVTDKTMGVLGLQQSLLARNASLYTNAQNFVAPLVGPGETADLALSISECALMDQQYSLMDQSREMNHGNANGFGGALTFLNVWTTSPAPATCVPDVPGPPNPGTTTTSSSTTTIAPETSMTTTTTISPTTTIYIPPTTKPGGEPEPEPETVDKSSTTIGAAPPIALPSRGSAPRLISGVRIKLSKKSMSFSVRVPRYSPTPINKYKFVVTTISKRIYRQGTVKAAAPLKYTTWTTPNLAIGSYSLSIYAQSKTGKVLEVYTEIIEVKIGPTKVLTITERLLPRPITPNVIIHASGVFQK